MGAQRLLMPATSAPLSPQGLLYQPVCPLPATSLGMNALDPLGTDPWSFLGLSVLAWVFYGAAAWEIAS